MTVIVLIVSPLMKWKMGIALTYSFTVVASVLVTMLTNELILFIFNFNKIQYIC